MRNSVDASRLVMRRGIDGCRVRGRVGQDGTSMDTVFQPGPIPRRARDGQAGIVTPGPSAEQRAERCLPAGAERGNSTGQDRLFAGLGGNGTLLQSEDGGESWSGLGEQAGGITALAVT